MRVLLDESVPRSLGFAIEGHFVRTVQTAGFAGLLNGDLLVAMRNAGFDVLVTFDQNLPYQQNSALPVAIVVLVAPNNRVQTAMKFVPALLDCLSSLAGAELVRLALP